MVENLRAWTSALAERLEIIEGARQRDHDQLVTLLERVDQMSDSFKSMRTAIYAAAATIMAAAVLVIVVGQVHK